MALAVFCAAGTATAQISSTTPNRRLFSTTIDRPDFATFMTTARTAREILFSSWRQQWREDAALVRRDDHARGSEATYEAFVGRVARDVTRYDETGVVGPELADVIARKYIHGELAASAEERERIFARKLALIRARLADLPLCVAMAEYLWITERAAAEPHYRRLREQMVRATRLLSVLGNKVAIDPWCRVDARGAATHLLRLVLEDLNGALETAQKNAVGDAGACPIHAHCPDANAECRVRLLRSRCARDAAALRAAAAVVHDSIERFAETPLPGADSTRSLLDDASRQVSAAALEWTAGK